MKRPSIRGMITALYAGVPVRDLDGYTRFFGRDRDGNALALAESPPA